VFPSSGARYLRKVLRLRVGDHVTVFDGSREHVVRLDTCSRDEVSGEIVERTGTVEPRATRITLAFCCVRPGPTSEILRHGTEAGVSLFVPLLGRRSCRRPAGAKERWEAVTASAAAQCGRVDVPKVAAPMNLDDFVQTEASSGMKIILSAGARSQPLLDILQCSSPPGSVLLMVGPEGGFDPDEESRAAGAGFVPASLGPLVLRTETAAVLASGIVFLWFQWKASPEGTASPVLE
jgi:16S rRNA (uracil1498-N3)-methyltransferase